ncbi:MAG: ribonuclease PH [Clostridia bacterium]
MRTDGRSKEQLREIRITRHYTIHAEGSVLVEFGNTKVLCNASVEDKAPPFKVGTGEGFVTAEYAMLPRSVQTRIPREISKLKKDGRASEIQRLVGRSLRGAVDMKLLGERLVVIDCDVIQADGGTRTAAVTGGFVALHDACSWLLDQGMISKMPILDFVAAVSVGIRDGEVLLDLCYEEDSTMDVDMNVVMTGQGGLVEIQGTAEGRPFSKKQLDAMLRLAGKGIDELIRIQKESLGIPL